MRTQLIVGTVLAVSASVAAISSPSVSAEPPELHNVVYVVNIIDGPPGTFSITYKDGRKSNTENADLGPGQVWMKTVQSSERIGRVFVRRVSREPQSPVTVQCAVDNQAPYVFPEYGNVTFGPDDEVGVNKPCGAPL